MRLGHQNRYQKWFQKKHLATPGAEALVPDLVRFVCCCFHPTNQILQVKCFSFSTNLFRLVCLSSSQRMGRETC